MNITKLRRDLISCGKDFFIDNYNEIKQYALGDISKSELDALVKVKSKWSNIKTLDNRISAVKMIFENKLYETALKITIGSRAKVDVINEAKNIFESELGRTYSDVIDKIDGLVEPDLIPEISNVINSKLIQDLCDLDDFQFQKGVDKLIEFELNDNLSEIEITNLLIDFKKSKLTITKYIETIDVRSKEHLFITLASQLMSYCDTSAPNKKQYNEYDDKRTIARCNVWPDDWINSLFTYKIKKNDVESLTPIIKNAIRYLKSPISELTILSENDKKMASLNLLKNPSYDSSNFLRDLKEFFDPYNIVVNNELNLTSVYCTVLYSKDVKKLWRDMENAKNDDDKGAFINQNEMNIIPLNQIFYGPPGTGKTYSVSNKATEILNSKNNSTNLTRVQKFDRILNSIRSTYASIDFNAKSNSLYRNERAIMWMFGWLLDPLFDQSNSLSKSDALQNGFDASPSSWAQRSQYISHFNLVDDWRDSSNIVLNSQGIDLKNAIRSYLVSNNLNYNDLKSWDQNPPDFVKAFYQSVLANQLNDNFTPVLKTLFCALNMALNNDLYKQDTENRKATPQEKDLAISYFDINTNGEDLKWIGHIGRILQGLGIVDQSNDLINNQFQFILTSNGEVLIDNIIDNWSNYYPYLFSNSINYDLGVELGQIRFITFHQSYSYEEFIEGIRPNLGTDNNINYSLEDGIFKQISIKAKDNPEKNYVLIIDEINRGNISKIFGELITVIESSKRIFATPKEHPQQVMLQYSKKYFGVPNNLYIIGTMNTADRSITNIDTALRRRFVFQEFPPIYDDNIGIVERNGINIYLKTVLKTMNLRIEHLLDKDHLIGHTYFINITTWNELCDKFRNSIIPLLQEYFYNDWEKIRLVLGDNDSWKKKEKDKFILKKKITKEGLFGKDNYMEDEYDDSKYFVNPDLASMKYDFISEEMFTLGFNEIN